MSDKEEQQSPKATPPPQTPPQAEELGESWVDVTQAGPSHAGSSTPASSITHQAPYPDDECIRLLREAAHESGQTSQRDSERSSPKSPPNSPVQMAQHIDWNKFYVHPEIREPVRTKPKIYEKYLTRVREQEASSSQGLPLVQDPLSRSISQHSLVGKASVSALSARPSQLSIVPEEKGLGAIAKEFIKKKPLGFLPKEFLSKQLTDIKKTHFLLPEDTEPGQKRTRTSEEPTRETEQERENPEEEEEGAVGGDVGGDPQDSEFLNDWSSRPDTIPPKNWAFRPPKRDLLSIRYARVGETSVFSKKGLATLFLTNLLSLLIGTGVGLWISKHGLFVTAVKVR